MRFVTVTFFLIATSLLSQWFVPSVAFGKEPTSKECRITLTPLEFSYSVRFSQEVADRARIHFRNTPTFEDVCRRGEDNEIVCNLRLSPANLRLGPLACHAEARDVMASFFSPTSTQSIHDSTAAAFRFLEKHERARLDWTLVRYGILHDEKSKEGAGDSRFSLEEQLKEIQEEKLNPLNHPIGIGIGELSFSNANPQLPMDGAGVAFRPKDTGVRFKVTAATMDMGSLGSDENSDEAAPEFNPYSMASLFKRADSRTIVNPEKTSSVSPLFLISIPAESQTTFHLSAGTTLSAGDRERADFLGAAVSTQLEKMILTAGYRHSLQSDSRDTDQIGSLFAGVKARFGPNCEVEMGGRFDAFHDSKDDREASFFLIARIKF